MKAFPVLILAIALATGNAFAGKSSKISTSGGYFYVTASADTDSDGDAMLSVSRVFPTLAGCETAAGAATGVFQHCVPRCDPANPTTAYFLEQQFDGDSADPKSLIQAIGPYGFLSDCEAAITMAPGAGITDLLPSCAVATLTCTGH